MFRLDADTAGAKDAVPELLARFAAAPPGCFVSVQMVAKGHDFPDVTLGVVLDADSTLRFPDFRAEERTSPGIAPAATRPGRPRAARRPRARADGRPGRPAILAGPPRHAHTEGFVTGELGRREALRCRRFSDRPDRVPGRGRRGGAGGRRPRR